MVAATPKSERARIQSLVTKAIKSSQLSRKEHLMLTSSLLAAFNLTTAERNQINRVFDYIRMGKVKLVD